MTDKELDVLVERLREFEYGDPTSVLIFDVFNAITQLRSDLAAARALLKNVRSDIIAVCCDHDGNVCFNGSDGDRRVMQDALGAIDAALANGKVNDLAIPSGGTEAGPEEERIEAAYWRFDGRHKGYGQWEQAPQSERDAFKAEMRNALNAEKTRAEMRLVSRGWRKDGP
jgi:hypothetical protein